MGVERAKNVDRGMCVCLMLAVFIMVDHVKQNMWPINAEGKKFSLPAIADLFILYFVGRWRL